MAINSFLQADLNRLIKPAWDKRKLKVTETAEAPEVLGGRGEAVQAYVDTAADQYIELLNVWSEIIITEDGAFEVPPNWPDSGAYTAGFSVPDPMPASLILDGGVLSLDTGVQYYLQKRVHVVYLSHPTGDSKSPYRQDNLFIPFEMPYLNTGYYQGVTKQAGQLLLNLKMTSSGSQEGLIKQGEFEAMGIPLG